MSVESSQSKKWKGRKGEGRRWEGAQIKRKKKSRVEHVGCVGCMWCVCALSSWNSSTVECGIALYSPPVKTVDAHLGEAWFGNSHLAGWGISCYAATPKHSSNAMLNSEPNSPLATHTKHNQAPAEAHCRRIETSQTTLRKSRASSSYGVWSNFPSSLLVFSFFWRAEMLMALRMEVC